MDKKVFLVTEPDIIIPFGCILKLNIYFIMLKQHVMIVTL